CGGTMTWELFEKFIKDKRFLANLSEETLESYGQVYARWEKYAGGMPTQDLLDQFVIGMREASLSVSTCNISIRSFNSFLTWLYEKGHTSEHFIIKKLKEEKRVMKTFGDDQLADFLSWKPQTDGDWRFYTMFCTLADTGIRVKECLTIKTDDIDF